MPHHILHKLREGDEYKFFVDKELTLPDNSVHFLLVGPDANKYLIPVVRYSDYGITVGTSIKCRVDRINCKGEVFLEPENPWYIEGKSYEFKVTGTEFRTNKSGTELEVVVVEDKRGNKILVPVSIPAEELKRGSNLKFLVERISKGKLHLVQTKGGIVTSLLKTGTTYEFEIERSDRGMDDEECFVVRDPFGGLHTIIKAYYKHYGFDTGTRFKGRVIKKKNGGGIIIEPYNPFYKEGSIIKLEITDFNKSLINNLFTLSLKDKYGFTHCIDTPGPPVGNSVRCRVIMIKKGKPLLELL